MATEITAIICSACGGDPRRAVSCKSCGGAAIGVPSEDGFLVWSQSVDDFTIAIRKIRRIVNATIHVGLLITSLALVVLFAWQIAKLEDPTIVLSAEFWTMGHWYVTAFWCGILVGCFLVFRMKEFFHESKPLPHWGELATQRTNSQPVQHVRASYRFDVEPYFSRSAMDVVEGAYQVAKTLERIEVTPGCVFAAALASSTGSLFLLRLGTNFDQFKGPVARVLSSEPSGKPPIVLSRDVRRTLTLAYAVAREHERKQVSSVELFIQSFLDSPKIQAVFDQLGYPAGHVLQVAEWIRIEEELREDHERFVVLAGLKPGTVMDRAMTARQTPLLDRFSSDLTLLARDGYLAPAIDREKEMEELLRVFESGRQSAALVGENGVGKTALVRELARRMVEEDVPRQLFDKRLVSVDVAKVIAAGDPTLAPDRLVSMLNEVALSGNIVLVMQGIEALSGVGSGGALDLSEILASEIERRGCLVIVTTTPRAWTQFIERRSLGAKLAKISVMELNESATLRVLMARSGYIEYQQRVFFSFGALEKAATLGARYVHEIATPESAIEILREAAVVAHTSRGDQSFVLGEDVAKIVQEKTGIPVETITQSESEKLLSLEDKLHDRVIGQDQAVVAVSQAMRRARADVREGKRPIANFLFLGPTGVGKTELSKALATVYFGNEENMIRLDMSEYQDAASYARLIGAPGDERGGLLTEAVRRRPFSLVLLDELEKAHPDILNLFLQVMDDGRLTDGVGRTIDFTNVVVIATSNAGTAYIQEEVRQGTEMDVIRTALLERELKGVYRPEFLNRFDGIIVFKPLTENEVERIAQLLIQGIARRMSDKGIVFEATDDAIRELAKAGFDPQFGARPLRRVIQERVDTGLADLLLRGEVGRKDRIILEAGGALRVEKAAPV